MRSPFLTACEEGNFAKVRAILQRDTISRNEILNERNTNGWNCLHWAAWHSDIGCTKYLLTMKELDINAKTSEGKTAFHVALQPRHVDQHSSGQILPCIKIIKMLLEVNSDFVNCLYPFNEGITYPLNYAIDFLHIDVVKLLINFGGKVDEESGYPLLRVVAVRKRVDCLRYLVLEMNYDPCRMSMSSGMEPWYEFVFLAIIQGPSKEEIELSLELMSHIFDSPAEIAEVCCLLLDCFHRREMFSRNVRKMFLEIVKLLLPLHRKKYFVQKILDAQLPSDYCLITLTLFEMIGRSHDVFLYAAMGLEDLLQFHLWVLKQLKCYFLYELFHLFSADERFFNEYITEVIKMGWTFDESDLLPTFCASLTEEISSQKVFNFIRSLIRHEFRIALFVRPLPLLSPSRMGDHLLNVFVPLSNFVHVPSELIRIFRSKRIKCHYNFNESENCVNDYNKLAEGKSEHPEVVSLKNLSRMSIRKYVFQNYAHYEALTILYSLNIPMTLKMFLCYNFLNLKF